MVIQLNSQMYRNIFKVQGHNRKLMIEQTINRGIFPLPVLTQGPKPPQYGINLLAKVTILHYFNQFAKTIAIKTSTVRDESLSPLLSLSLLHEEDCLLIHNIACANL